MYNSFEELNFQDGMAKAMEMVTAMANLWLCSGDNQGERFQFDPNREEWVDCLENFFEQDTVDEQGYIHEPVTEEDLKTAIKMVRSIYHEKTAK